MKGSIRAYAKYRKSRGLPGGSHAGVQKAVKTGRIHLVDGQIDFEQADQDWEANSDHRQQRPVKPAPDPDPAAKKEETPQGESFFEAQRRHEWVKVQKAELDLKVRKGDLILRTDLEQQLSKHFTSVRNRMLLVPDKLAPRVAVISDTLECRALIDREIKQVLTAMSEYPQNAA